MTAPKTIVLPHGPALVAGHGRGVILTADGEVMSGDAAATLAALRAMSPPMLVHAPATWRRLGAPGTPPCLDLLDLFAFACPARAAAPTPRGLCLALDLDPPPPGPEAAVAALEGIAAALLRRLAALAAVTLGKAPAAADPAALAARMGLAGWPWAPFALAALGQPEAMPGLDTLRAWKRLPKWEDAAPATQPSAHPVGEGEARARLAAILGPGAEQRPGQADYSAAASAAFAPREARGDPTLVLAEAGTGIGKTLGYIAPASLWAERNGGTVWVSTFTKHLQRQVSAELGKLFPNPAERRRRVVVRKGRENYLCLLNMDDALATAGAGNPVSRSPLIVPLALLSRWILATDDGDLQGGDLPGWFAELFGAPLLAGLADRRGECLHGACDHYRRCFVEHTVRRARGADIVVANHALVMAQASWGGLDDDTVPSRYVFDEGHHLFDAADGAFSAALTGGESAELRRWLLGAEEGRSRAKGLRARLADIVAGRPDLETPMLAAVQAARALARPGSWERADADLIDPDANPTEVFLGLVAKQVRARDGRDAGAQECDLFPVSAGLPEAAAALERALARIVEPLEKLRTRLLALLEDEAEELDEATRTRAEAAARLLERRALGRLNAWLEMLGAVGETPPEPGTRPDYVLFLRLDRGRETGFYRHWLDPTVPFVATLARPAQGLLVTSATLRDEGAGEADELEKSWLDAEARVGAAHLPSPAIRATVKSPFDYAGQTRAFVVTDVSVDDPGQVAGAYRALFEASGGGALGLFTAISRLRATHARIAPGLEAAGIPLYAQHVDPMDNATLVDIMRAEEEACLLGTDAMRDGVDVPGRALRLVVFDRVPWPRPDILHRERRTHLGGGDAGAWDDRVARMRLRQAFGRLVRRATDRGVFVLLDRRMPSRLLTAFPAGVTARRVGLAEAVGEVEVFLNAET